MNTTIRLEAQDLVGQAATMASAAASELAAADLSARASMLRALGEALDENRDELVGDDVEEQTRQVLRDVGAVLTAAGLGFGDVVKSTVHLANLHREFAGFNRAYGEFFKEGFPVRRPSDRL